MDDNPRDPIADLRLRPLCRDRVLAASPDQLLPPEHPVRAVATFVAALDFTSLFERIDARAGMPGAPAYDPRVLFALWLFATVEGVYSARDLERRCREDLPFVWLCGQDAPNYHTLASFFSANAEFLHRALADHLEVLLEHRLVELHEVTIDGRKMPANASKQSLHREPTLSRHRQQAEEHLARLHEQRQRAAGETGRQAAARRRAAIERTGRLAAAVARVKERQAERAERNRKDEPPASEARASETDPDVRKMKLSHGGYVPAYNTQTATDTASGLIVAVVVTAAGSDGGLLPDLVDRVEGVTGHRPGRLLADAGYANLDDVRRLEESHVEVYMPTAKERQELKTGKDPYAAKKGDPPAVARWRARMGTAAAQAVYQRRAPVAEGVHARQSNRGWKRYRLRGLAKAGIEALWQALAHNLCVLAARSWLQPLALRAATA
jgi:transposase